ncbi:MAG: DUF72 domain-containing protein [Candidatus Hydrogenedentes bacterium]|nr:DUF72 domain-containing protein [Candidatus Hydrogenedentota bacterium]
METEALGAVRVGPAGWSYDDWKGIVYPPGMPKSLHPLTFLCEYFDTVEVNSTFYRPPSARNCASWVGKVFGNPRFMFTAKLWERFTHQRETWATDTEIRLFTDGIAPLAEAGKLGALLAQFPWSFKRTPANREWLARVLDAFAAYPLALEVRHASWDVPEVYAGLAARNIAFCNIDQPLFAKSVRPSAAVTARIGYVRLHGRNYDDWFREDAGRDDRYNYLYTEDELKPWLNKIQEVRKQVDAAYVITNNHFEGQAVVNALEIQGALGKRTVALPQYLVDKYPRLRKLREIS